MLQQLDLIKDDPKRLARRCDPSTSKEAARRAGAFAPSHRAQVLGALRRFGSAGAEQLAAATRLEAYSVRKRLPELAAAGLAAPTDRTRLTVSGRAERVWRAL